jgi:hypothetical protein
MIKALAEVANAFDDDLKYMMVIGEHPDGECQMGQPGTDAESHHPPQQEPDPSEVRELITVAYNRLRRQNAHIDHWYLDRFKEQRLTDEQIQGDLQKAMKNRKLVAELCAELANALDKL